MKNRPPSRTHSTSGFSLVELIVVIAIIGVMGAMAMRGFKGSKEATERSHAESTVARLNAAIALFSQTRYKVSTAANNGATTDEVKVLKTLQWTAGANEAPTFTPYFQPGTGSLTTTYRLRWNGISFEILAPGTAGSGLTLDQSTGDMKPTKVSLTGFTPDPAAN